MARNRQRARDRKRKNRENDSGKIDDASAEGLDLTKAGDDGALDHDVEPEPELEEELNGDGDRLGLSLEKEDLGSGAADVAVPATKGKPGPRLVNFIKACAAELQRVQWPDRRQVGQATAVVLGFVVIAGAFLGFADFVSQKIVDLIL